LPPRSLDSPDRSLTRADRADPVSIRSCASTLSRFLCSDESRAAYKDRVVAATAADTIHTKLFGLEWPDAAHRVLRNRIVDEWLAVGSPASGPAKVRSRARCRSAGKPSNSRATASSCPWTASKVTWTPRSSTPGNRAHWSRTSVQPPTSSRPSPPTPTRSALPPAELRPGRVLNWRRLRVRGATVAGDRDEAEAARRRVAHGTTTSRTMAASRSSPR
jgi:hypothetical protein